MIRELRKATESLVQIGLSIGLQRITEVPVLFKRFHKYVIFSGCAIGWWNICWIWWRTTSLSIKMTSMPCLEYLSLCALCDGCESNMMSMKASARTRSVFLSPLFVSNWGQNIKRVWLFLSWQGNELPQTWNDDQRSIFWFVSSSFGVFSGKLLYFPFYSCQFATTPDMIFVKTFTLADFAPIIFYPKARNLRHITFCDKTA